MQSLSKTKSFSGIFTALVTPFTVEGKIDWKAFERLVEKQLAAKIDGLVVFGTTGESPTLNNDEKNELITRALKLTAGKCTVLAGTGLHAKDSRSKFESIRSRG